MIKKDDPRLTAFVLGELDASETKQIQAAIESSPELEKAVVEIRATVEMLGEQYALELTSVSGKSCELSEAQRAAILSAGTDSDFDSDSDLVLDGRSGGASSIAAGANGLNPQGQGRAVWLRWAVAAGIGAVLASLAFYAGNNAGKGASNPEGVAVAEPLSPEQIVLQSSKYSSETWEQYVDRMHTIGLVDEGQLQAWKKGGEIEVVRAFPTHLTRAAETLAGERVQEEGEQAGVIVATEKEPLEAQKARRAERRARWVPYVDDFEFRFTIPAAGESPDDQTLVAFSDLWFDEGGTVSNTRNGQRVAELRESFRLTQRPSETVDGYAKRLMLLGKITPEQFAAVEQGESVELEIRVPVVRTRRETRTRAVPVTRTRSETKTRQIPVTRMRVEQRTRRVRNQAGEMVEESYTVNVPYTENIAQNYTVQVPFTEQVTQNYMVEVPYTEEGSKTITLGADNSSGAGSDYGREMTELYGYFDTFRASATMDVSENGVVGDANDIVGDVVSRGGVVTGGSGFGGGFGQSSEFDGVPTDRAGEFGLPRELSPPAPTSPAPVSPVGGQFGGDDGEEMRDFEGRPQEPFPSNGSSTSEFNRSKNSEFDEDFDRSFGTAGKLGENGDRVRGLAGQLKDEEDLVEEAEETEETIEGEKDNGRNKGEVNKPQRARKSWKRIAATANTTRLMIGDQDELDMRGMQVNVQVDGFRARVLIDTFYYNDRDQQLEGNFKLRLPDDASLYYFAFGQSSFEYVPEGKLAEKEFIQPAGGTQFVSLAVDKIAEQRQQTWENVKEARMVRKEKAAHAYQQTVKRRVDPALVEWNGAGVFAARVFPLAPQKLHRIVVGYDVNLTTTDGGLTYRLDLPEQLGQCRIALNVSQLEGVQYSVTPEVKPDIDEGVRNYEFTNSKLGDSRTIELTCDSPVSVDGSTLLTSHDEEAGDYWAAQLRPELPVAESETSSHGMFLVDSSLSSNPDKFNVWLKLLRATLTENRDSMKQFAVLVFNVESYFWQDEYVENTPENVDKLIADLEQLALEGATDLYGAVERLSTTEWVAEDQQSPSLFLLSDGAATWGETDLRMLQNRLADSDLGSLFAYQTGLTGTAINGLRYLADQSGGAVFSVATEAEVVAAATAHRKRAWKIETISVTGGEDVLTAGRVSWVYPGQTITIVGRGEAAGSGELVLSQGQQKKVVPFEMEHRIESDLAGRMYGYVAVGQLESLGSSVEEFAAAYARHFRVTGQTCSLLMLETEEDYKRFNIVSQEDPFVIKTKTASSLIEKTLRDNKQELISPKARLMSWVGKLQEMPGLEFKMPTALALVVDDIEVPAISQPLVCENRNVSDLSDEFVEHLRSGKLDYSTVLAESKRRGLGAAGDAIKTLSSLVENSPGDLTLARDLAFVAMELDHPAHAYGLLRRVLTMRPFEPTVYPAMAKCLTQLGQADMALLYYEIAIEAKFQNRGEDYRKIVTTEYMNLLRKIVAEELSSNVVDYAKARLETLAKRKEVIGENDIVITMMWNVDQSDVDLHVVEPSGEDCHYGLRQTKSGGQITRDVTDGFGPEMYWIRKAPVGKYEVKVKYYANQANRTSMRSKVYLTIYRNYGQENQKIRFETVELNKVGELEDVLTIGIEP